MDKSDAISMISKIRSMTNNYIENQMRSLGMDGLVTSHGDILFALFNHGSLTMAELAEKISKDKSTVTPLVKKLQDLGYLYKEKDIKDSRVTFVKLTDAGNMLKPKFYNLSDRLMEMFYKDIDSEEVDTFFKTLEKIYQNMCD